MYDLAYVHFSCLMFFTRRPTQLALSSLRGKVQWVMVISAIAGDQKASGNRTAGTLAYCMLT